MRYAKLVNNYPSYAPRRMRIGSAWVYNPTDEHLLAAGYLPVIAAEAPETDEAHFAEPHWAEENGKIVQSWTIETLPDEVTPEEIAAAIEEAMR